MADRSGLPLPESDRKEPSVEQAESVFQPPVQRLDWWLSASRPMLADRADNWPAVGMSRRAMPVNRWVPALAESDSPNFQPLLPAADPAAWRSVGRFAFERLESVGWLVGSRRSAGARPNSARYPGAPILIGNGHPDHWV